MPKSCSWISKGSLSTPKRRARLCSWQKPSRTQSQKKQLSQNLGSKCSALVEPMRRQWWQSTRCWRNISCKRAFRLANRASESVVTAMPAFTLVAQASFSFSSPWISTRQSPQAALGLSPS